MELVKIPDPTLARHCTPLKAGDLKADTYTTLIADMKTTMAANNGIGLAANQIGKDLALFVIDQKLADEYGVASVFANPEITDYSKERDVAEEGCLSIPEYWQPITRAKKIMFKALNEKGEKVKFRARGMLARVLQHETDHLNGLTIKDRHDKHQA